MFANQIARQLPLFPGSAWELTSLRLRLVRVREHRKRRLARAELYHRGCASFSRTLQDTLRPPLLPRPNPLVDKQFEHGSRALTAAVKKVEKNRRISKVGFRRQTNDRTPPG